MTATQCRCLDDANDQRCTARASGDDGLCDGCREVCDPFDVPCPHDPSAPCGCGESQLASPHHASGRPRRRFDPQDIPVADGYSREDFGTDDEVRGWNLCREYVIAMCRGDEHLLTGGSAPETIKPADGNAPSEVPCGASVSFEPPLPDPGQPQGWPQTNFTCSLPRGHRTPHSDGLGFTWTDPFGRGLTNKSSTSSDLPSSTGPKGDS